MSTKLPASADSDHKRGIRRMMKPGLLLLLLVAVRIPGLDDPLVGRYDERMNETAAIARNYHELEMNILYPRIDWGGNGPGYAEEAFQIGSSGF